VNGLRERLYPNGFRPLRYGVRLFAEANLNPHYMPFRGIALSLVVHASLLTGLITIPLLLADDERPRLEEAVILDADDLKDVLYLPLLGGEKPPKTAENSDPSEASPAPPVKEGLSYPGPQPILSKFPVPTNHTQTILQPALTNPPQLDLSLHLPNLVRLPPPEVLRKLTLPDAAQLPLPPPPMLAALPKIAMNETSQPLAAPRVDSRLQIPEAVAPAVQPSAPLATVQLDPLSGPARPLAAPRVDSRLNVPEAVTPGARPSLQPVAQLDQALTGPARPLAAPLAESKFKIPEQTTSVTRPALPVPTGQPSLPVQGSSRPLAAPLAESKIKVSDSTTAPTQPSRVTTLSPLGVPTTIEATRPLAAPLAESKIKVLDSATPPTQPTRAAQAAPLSVPMTSGPSRPLAAPLAESKLKVADSTAPQTQLSRTTTVAPLDVPLAGPSRPLAAPLAESRLKVSDSAAPVVRPSPATAATPKLDVPLTGPTRPLAAPMAESKLKVPESSEAPAARQAAPTNPPLDVSQITNQPLVALSPMPGRRDQPVTVPAGEARGQFAISPQPNLTFPGTEPGGRATTANATAANNTVTGLVNPNKTTSGSTSTAPANSANAAPGAGANVFPGITILGGETAPSSTSRNSAPPNSSASDKSPPLPLQTSYGITILASGGSGGGLPDFGVFSNEQVHTVYLDMRRTIEDEPINWTVEFGVKQLEATGESERVATVGGQQEVILPFPIEKERPAIPGDLVRRYSGRLVIAYAVVTPEGKIEQLSIKQSPDPALNEIVLSSLRKWTFRPARRNGAVIPAKILLGIPVRAY
jgi:hypothetical protein